MRLHIRVVGAEQLLGAIDRELLGDVDEPTAAVVAPARVALGILVVHRGRLRGEHGRARVVLGRDQPKGVALPPQLAGDRVRDLRVRLAQRVPVRNEAVACGR
jgi:hypothetical protein